LKKPLMATGDVIDNYEPLFYYWKRARNLNREDLIEKTLIREEDLELLKNTIERNTKLNLEDLLNKLSKMILNRIDASVAKEALKDYGISMSEESAREFIARILAGWIVEAGEIRGILKLRL